MMNIIQKTGIALFIFASVILVALLFLGQYKLNEQAIESIESDSTTRAQLQMAIKPMMNTHYTSNFRFVSDLETHLKKANEAILSKYSITEEETERLINQYEGKEKFQYDTAVVNSLFENEGEIQQFKRKKLKEYTSWMQGKEYSSLEGIGSQLPSTISSINNAIVSERGFGEEKIKNLKLSLTKSASIGFVQDNNILLLLLTVVLGITGAFLYILPKLLLLPGIKNNHVFHSSNTGWGTVGFIIGSLLILFYVILYWYPEYMTSWLIIADPLSKLISGQEASQWFFYGLLYTLAILVMGIRMIIKYRHSNYHIIRTLSVMFFQTAFAFLIPEILIRLNKPYYDFKNIWPLDYDFFFDYNLSSLISSGTFGLFILGWGIALILLAVPLFTYFYGKRWYCSWVCGCGGLAETLGDPYRQLSDKSLKAWSIERWMVHGILLLSIIMTIAVLYTYFTGAGVVLGINSYSLRQIYGFMIGAAFAGVVGVGFYPLMGNRVWCRFGCPLAAYIGLIQRFKSRFRITTNGGQCISCGNCSTYCEMGIDVRWYAQRGQNIIRASCVGCGVCASVCPRGVLKLENDKEEGRFGKPILIGNDSVKLES